MTPPLYVDYNATTPLDEAVLQAMMPFFSDVWGNPSSVHQIGRKARALLDEARDKLAARFRCRPSELIFTSGGTESSNLAVCGAARALSSRGKHLITSAVEHHVILHACQYLVNHENFTLTIVPTDSEGRVDPDSISKALRPDTVLVSIMAANNELGTLQPIAEIGEICRERGVAFHTDAVQWLGKEPFVDIQQFNADFVSICAHKLHGPKGAGLLYVRSPLAPDPILFGGGHENERRAGTENLPAIIGLVECLLRFLDEPVFTPARMTQLSEGLRTILESLEGVQVVSPRLGCLKNTVACLVERADSISLLAGLDLEGVCASSGSACASGSIEPSHVIQAIGKPTLASSLVRFSFGRENSLADLERLKATLPTVFRRAQVTQ
jgi:cysteine desulfurase